MAPLRLLKKYQNKERETMKPPPENTGATTGELRADAQQLGSSASNRIHSEIDARKGTAADQAKSVSSAIDRAASELDNETPQWLKSAFEQGAMQVRKFADTLEQKDSRQILSDLETLARNNPGTFLAGCAAVGFAAARVLRAGGSDASSGQSGQQPQFPPAQVDEPMFRPEGAEPVRNPRTTGEFA
jgi:hypothetical protein